MVPRLPSYGVYISQLVRFARCCTSNLDFNSRNLQLTSKRRVTDITSFKKLSESSSGHTLTCRLNLVKYRFKNMLRKESLTQSSTVILSSDFFTLYTTIPHHKLKSRLATIIRNSFLHKNGNRRYKYLVLGRKGPYFVKKHSNSKSKYTEEDIINMLEFLVDNIFVVFAGKVFQQIIGIPIGTNCAPLLADIFLHSYGVDFIQFLLSAGRKRLAPQFNFTYRYIDDVLSINNPDFENYLGQMYSPELEIKDTKESNTSASYFDLLC